MTVSSCRLRKGRGGERKGKGWDEREGTPPTRKNPGAICIYSFMYDYDFELWKVKPTV